MDVCVRVSGLRFASGDEIDLAPDSIVLFVGPNGSGKTQSLKDIWSTFSSPRRPTTVSVSQVSLERTGTEANYLKFVQEQTVVRDNQLITSWTTISPPEALDQDWDRNPFTLMGPLFAKLIGAEDRLSAIQQRTRINRSKEVAKHPLPALDLDYQSEKKISKSFHKIFGRHLMLDRGAGSVVNLHVGLAHNPSVYGGEYSERHSDKVRKNPDVNSEGDGLKAAAGLLLNVMCIPKCVYLIDEPDVYLHPPQAYAAAKELVEISGGKQLFMATHNAHFVRGLLDTNSSRVVLVRLNRDGNGKQSVNAIEHSVFSDIDSDPLVRFSNLLESMFFNTAIICENEADCLFYRHLCSVLDDSDRDGSVFWLSSHGKQNIRKFSQILKKLGLRVIAITDLDVVNNKTTLQPLFESHGGEWSDVESNFEMLARLIGTRKPTLATKDIKAKIVDILDRIAVAEEEIFPRDAAKGIKKALSGASPWREVKETGIRAFGKGANQVAAKELLGAMEEKGILAPSVGEMESFYPLYSSRGVAWVKQVLELDLKYDPGLTEAREFGEKIIASMQ